MNGELKATGRELSGEKAAGIDVNGELNRVFKQIYYTVVRVDLKSGGACVLHRQDRPQDVGQVFDWKEYLQSHMDIIAPADRNRLLEGLDSRVLLERMEHGESALSIDFSCTGNGIAEYAAMKAFFIKGEDDTPYAYVMANLSGEEHLLKDIIRQYVYNNCDYFIYLDAKNNSYTTFGGNASGTPLPPADCLDYAEAVVEYARKFVYAEDQERTIREMSLPRVLEVLEEKGVHSFTCGIRDPKRGYTRKRLTYRYYNREQQMIMLSRTDITDVYMENLTHRSALKKAQQSAVTDPLTGLLNYRGLVEQISESLAERSQYYALMFIDLDNFKRVNDTLGHQKGDELLRLVARTIRGSIRSSDIAGRVGGDEFIVFAARHDEADEGRVLAQRLCDRIRGLSGELGNGIDISGSIGVALAPEDGADYDALVKRADQKAYLSKRDGKSRYSI